MLTASEELTPITGQQVREAALHYPRGKSRGLDGWSVRHLLLLDDQHVQALASILNQLEADAMHGKPPPWTTAVTLLTKPTGGYRPITITMLPVRLWALVRRPTVQEFERAHSGGPYAGTPSLSCTQAVWNHLIRQEASKAVNYECGGYSIDIQIEGI
eukprot:3270084-Amphidinium_carterae.1